MVLLCLLLDFFDSLSYDPRHVPFRNFIRQYRLGLSVTSFLE